MAAGQNERLLKQLRSAFLVEARDHVHEISSVLLLLERGAATAEAAAGAERAFRAAHSLKGAARAVELGSVELLCQSLEDALSALHRQRLEPTAAMLDLLHRVVDAASVLIEATARSTSTIGVLPDLPALRQELKARLAQALPAESPGFGDESSERVPDEARDAGWGGALPAEAAVALDAAAAAGPTGAAPDGRGAASAADASVVGAAGLADGVGIADAEAADAWVRVTLSKLETNLLESEELQFARMAARQRNGELRDLSSQLAEWRKRSAAAAEHGRRWRHAGLPTPLVEFVAWSHDAAARLEARLDEIARHARQDLDALSKTCDALQTSAKRLLYLPFATVTRPLPKLVRDLARQQGKEADLMVDGEEVDLDRRIVERLKDPLVHLLRNAVDHGVEPSAQRVARGKPPRATLRLAATIVDGQTVRIEIADDGTGIDTEAVRRRIVAAGTLSAAEAAALDPAMVHAHVFDSGMTTRDEVTALSGRGLGLAIVRDRIVRLDGDVTIDSVAGRGTTFVIELPATRADDRGILVRVTDRLLLFPSRSTVSVGRCTHGAVRAVEGLETLVLGGRALPLARLARALDLPAVPAAIPPAASETAAGRGDTLAYVVAAAGRHSAAFAVDEILGEHEVVVKPMPEPLAGLNFFDGISILGAGVVVPVLDIADLIRATRRLSAASEQATGAASPVAPRRTILVAEDSITSRLLLKAILESAGHEVRTAVDGRDAYEQLLSGRFALLVSDVDMPHLDGCDLTARIRANRRLADLPVVLVTARETPADRTRGIEAGANAYLGKRGFDQGELLRIVEDLM
ncbi:MAG: response regulator [Lautropia sp.]